MKVQIKKEEMANNYKIKGDIKIVKRVEEAQAEPNKQKEGQFEYIISGNKAGV